MPDPISWAHSWPYFAIALAAGYLLGSIPFGLLLTRLAGLGDIRNIGSGSIGATNVLRTGRKGLAAATLLLDGGKGAVAALIAGLNYGPDMAVTAAAAAVIGHLFPVWLKFRGGKGFATVLGVLLALAWPVGLACCAVWLAVAALFRYSSVATMAALASSPVLAWWLSTPQLVELAILLAVLCIARHHENIRRLIKGEESKIRLSKD
ncbi:MAG: glycerol-3-phosphate 1-O-acyltransferase PlsY [Pseudomonadota bacterium]|nr:glycerol-3-phosphate 1-O-acyltransferase PlsY [Pseudomonadota bacterium]